MKKIVIYFSASGITEKRARELAAVTGSDIQAIVPAQRYSLADLDWTNQKSRSYQENLDDAVRPALEHEFGRIRPDLSGLPHLVGYRT